MAPYWSNNVLPVRLCRSWSDDPKAPAARAVSLGAATTLGDLRARCRIDSLVCDLPVGVAGRMESAPTEVGDGSVQDGRHVLGNDQREAAEVAVFAPVVMMGILKALVGIALMTFAMVFYARRARRT